MIINYFKELNLTMITDPNQKEREYYELAKMRVSMLRTTSNQST